MLPLFTYKPTPNAMMAIGIPDTPVIIVSTNNVVFKPEIPEKYQEMGFENFVSYLTACPLRYALTDTADSFLPQHVCEFYFTACSYPGMIIGTIGNGEHTITITVQDVRRALRLPARDVYDKLPTEGEIQEVLTNLGYDLSKQGPRSTLVLKQCLPFFWKFITGVLGKCLTNKTSSFDQLNNFEQRVFWSIIKDKSVDYAQLFFDQLAEVIQKAKRPTFVPYPRWLALILEYINTGYVGEQPEDWVHPFVGVKQYKDIEEVSRIPKEMRKWIRSPYECERLPYVVPHIPAGDEEMNDEVDEDDESNSGNTHIPFTSPSNEEEDHVSTDHDSDSSPEEEEEEEEEGGNSPPAHLSPLHQSSPLFHKHPTGPLDTTLLEQLATQAARQGEQTRSKQPMLLKDFQSHVISTLDSLVQLTTAMSQRLTNVESDVATIKNLISDQNSDNTPSSPHGSFLHKRRKTKKVPEAENGGKEVNCANAL